MKDGPLKGKNKKEIIHDEDIQGNHRYIILKNQTPLIYLKFSEIEVLSIEGSSFTDPANPKSVCVYSSLEKLFVEQRSVLFR